MKRSILTLIIISWIFLSACDLDILGMGESEEAKIQQEETDSTGNKEENRNDYLLSIEKAQNPDNSDILSMGQSFAIDILTEDFERLDRIYLYSEEMKEIITLDETRKEIVFHNMDLGEVEKISEAYTYNFGSNKHVMVPVESNIYKLNIMISFNHNNEIIGFSYEEYQEDSSNKSRTIPTDITEEDFSFFADGLVINGTLTTPNVIEDEMNIENYPLVILVHGFGPSDRDSSIFENKPFQDMAWGLAQSGIATYRYDKRTYINEDVIDSQAFTVYDETINDAIAASSMAKELKNVDQSRVYILGASQGGYLLPRIAAGVPEAAGYIFVSSPAQNRKNYLKERYEYLAMEDGQISIKEHTAINQVSAEIDLLEMPNEIPSDQKVLGFHKNYWIDLNRYNPITEANRITDPVLVLQGERDYQTTIKQYNFWLDAFNEAENWTFKSYPDLNHFMMKGEGNSYSSEYREKNYVDEQVIQDIANFIFTN